MSAINRRQVLGATGLGLAALPLGAGSRARPPRPHPPATAAARTKVVPGADRLAHSGWAALRGQKVGVISNPTGILPDLSHIVDTMHASGKVDIVAVFGPEHGFRGTRAGRRLRGRPRRPAHRDHGLRRVRRDRRRSSPASTPGPASRPSSSTSRTSGARFYTYIWTMYEAMLAAVRTGARFVVLDRPNPVGGVRARPDAEARLHLRRRQGGDHPAARHDRRRAGPAVQRRVPAARRGWRRLAELQVIPVQNWKRDQSVRRHRPDLGDAEPEHADPGHRAALPGPVPVRGDQHVRGPRYDAAVRADRRAVRRLQVGARRCRRRTSRASSSGRRTSRRRISKNAQRALRRRPGADHRPARVEAITAATHMIVEARRLYPDFDLARRDAPGRWIDLLTGSDRFRTMLAAGATAEEIVGAWQVRDRRLDGPPREVPSLQGSAPMRALRRRSRSAVPPCWCTCCRMASLLQLPRRNRSGRFDQPYDGYAPKGTLLRDTTPARSASTRRRSTRRWPRSTPGPGPAVRRNPCTPARSRCSATTGRSCAQDGQRLRPEVRRRERDRAARRTSRSRCAPTRSSTWRRCPSCSPRSW